MFISLGYNSFNSFIPIFMRDKGISDTSNLYRNIFIYSAAGIPGSFVGALLIESKLGRKGTIGIALVLSAISVLLFLLTQDQVQLVLFTCIFQFTLQIAFCSEYTYTPELYPTEIRTTMYGFINGTARVVALCGPLLAGFLMATFSKEAAMFTSLVAFIAAALCVLGLEIETRGRNLD